MAGLHVAEEWRKQRQLLKESKCFVGCANARAPFAFECDLDVDSHDAKLSSPRGPSTC